MDGEIASGMDGLMDGWIIDQLEYACISYMIYARIRLQINVISMNVWQLDKQFVLHTDKQTDLQFHPWQAQASLPPVSWGSSCLASTFPQTPTPGYHWERFLWQQMRQQLPPSSFSWAGAFEWGQRETVHCPARSRSHLEVFISIWRVAKHPSS